MCRQRNRKESDSNDNELMNQPKKEKSMHNFAGKTPKSEKIRYKHADELYD